MGVGALSAPDRVTALYGREGLELVTWMGRPMVRAVCRCCGAHVEKQTTSRTPWPAPQARNLIIQQGWESRGGRWTCPPCVANRKKEKPVTLKVVSTAPRQPTVDDRRLIRMRVEEVYDTGTGIYSGEFSDAKVADELNVPVAWVSAIRELYGDDRCEARPLSRDDIAKAYADLKAESAKVEKLERDLRAALGDIDGIKQRLAPQLDRIVKAYDAVRR
jgi:hypothetical protein